MKANFNNPSNNRYYCMLLTENLFGQTEILISRGSSKRSKSVIRYIVFDDLCEAMREFDKLARLRLKHGYIEKVM